MSSSESSEQGKINMTAENIEESLFTTPCSSLAPPSSVHRVKHNTSISKKKHRQLTNTYFYLALIVAQQLLGYQKSTSTEFNLKDMVSHEALPIDNLAGKFPASPEYNDFFNPRFRWRNDAELALYAWSNYGKEGSSQINMLMTESRMPVAGRMQCYSSDGSGSSSSCAGVPHDPSLLDYDVIDVSWRYDIENEKSRIPEVSHRTSQNNRDIYDEQYERDLQVLHDKGFMTTLSAEENNRYEELAKAQFADFYQSVARPSKNTDGGISLVDISNNRPSSSGIKTNNNNPVVPKIESTRDKVFDNISTIYDAEGSSHAFNEIISKEEETPILNATIDIPEDDYLTLLSNTQVIQDLSVSVAEQGQESFETVFNKVVDGHENAHVDTEFTPFDDPLPFTIDDSFFDNTKTFENHQSEEQTGDLKERSYSPSSGFVSGSERSCSPNSQEDSSLDYRLHGKLLPEKTDDDDETGDRVQRRRGRQSKDNELVRKYNLPASAEELADMSHKALQRLLKDPALTEAQRSLIKKIRRRGRNKEAARKCRERRVTTTDSRYDGYS